MLPWAFLGEVTLSRLGAGSSALRRAPQAKVLRAAGAGGGDLAVSRRARVARCRVAERAGIE